MNKCANCEVKRWYARNVDYHIFSERDCPYVCDKQDENKQDEKEKKNDV